MAYFGLSDEDSSRVVYSAWDMPDPPEAGQQNLGTSGGGNISIRMQALRAFEPGLFASVLPDGRIAVVDSTGYRIKLVDLDGRVDAVLERPVPPTEVTPAIREAERTRRIEEAQAQEGGGMVMMVRGDGGGGTQRVDPDAVRRMMEERLESMIFAEEIPVIERMAADRDGRIWVQRSAGEPGEIGPTDLLTVDGRYLGTIPPDGLRIPMSFGPGGLMARVEEDEFDVPTLIVERMPEQVR